MARTIIAVDDNPANLRLIEMALQPTGFPLKTASSALEAISLCLAEHPAMLLVDVHMPNIDGLEMLERLVDCDEVFRDVPTILVTGDEQINRQKAKALINDINIVLKPIDFDEFAALVTKHYQSETTEAEM